MTDSMDYRLAFVLPESRQLIAMQLAGVFVLPQIAISRWERPAQELTRLIEEKWNIASIVLDVLWDERPDLPCAVIEVRTPPWSFSAAGFTQVTPDEVAPQYLQPAEREALYAILDATENALGPFSRIGWIEDVQAWIQDVSADGRGRLTGEVLQLSSGGGFCLVRLAMSSGPAYWLKATQAPNTREFAITKLLSVECPRYLPRIIAFHEDWNAWLMEEHGTSLCELRSLEVFQRAIHDMADVQKHFIGRDATLLAIGCDDHRNETLRSRSADLIAYLDEAMTLQTSTKVPRISTRRLKELATTLHRACSVQHELGIPESVIHRDINPGNILHDGSQSVFIDWCETAVGNPFITLEQMCVHAVRQSPEPERWARVFKDECKSCWAKLLTNRQIEVALQLAPLLSLLSSLYGRGDWLSSSERYAPNRLSYSRSLARYIDRAAQTPDVQEALCH